MNTIVTWTGCFGLYNAQ